MTDANQSTKSWTEWMVSSNDSLVAAASAYPHVRGGLPCLRDTRFTLGQMLAELCDTPGPDIVAARFDFNPGFIREALNGLALFLEDKPRMNDAPQSTLGQIESQTTEHDGLGIAEVVSRNAPRRPNKRVAALALSELKFAANRLRSQAAGNEVSEHCSLRDYAARKKDKADKIDQVRRWLEMWGMP